MAERFDVIVVGVGSMGSATCWHLARRGVRVLGLDQFDIPNDRSSSSGYSRLFRLAYFEHPDYVVLLKRALELWQQIERESNVKLLHLTGGLYVGRPDGELVDGSLQAARLHDLSHEVLAPADLARRYPAFRVPDDMVGFFEKQAGFVVPHAAISAFAAEAMRHGAVLRGNEAVREWKSTEKTVVVQTTQGVYEADRVVLCGGAWMEPVLRSHLLDSECEIDLRVTRQTMAWFWPRRPDAFQLGNFPVWAIDPAATRDDYRGVLYGFPMMSDNPGFKIALHWPGHPCDPDHVPRERMSGDLDPLTDGIRRFLPDADGPLLSLRTCLYTNSVDSHFVIDRHPEYDRVVLACGFSGHGYKFASVVGEALADLATEGRTKLPIGFLGLDRFGDRANVSSR